MGGVYNPINLNVYHYAGLNPVKMVDPTGEKVCVVTVISINCTSIIGARYQLGFAVDSNYDVYKYKSINPTIGLNFGIGGNVSVASSNTAPEYFDSSFVTLEGSYTIWSGEVGAANTLYKTDWVVGGGAGLTRPNLLFKTIGRDGLIYKAGNLFKDLLKSLKIGGNFNLIDNSISSTRFSKIDNPKKALEALLKMKDEGGDNKLINDAIKHYESKVNR